jgi:hypothetical protein
MLLKRMRSKPTNSSRRKTGSGGGIERTPLCFRFCYGNVYCRLLFSVKLQRTKPLHQPFFMVSPSGWVWIGVTERTSI